MCTQESLADKEEFVAKLRHEKDHLTHEHERTLQVCVECDCFHLTHAPWFGKRRS